MRCLSPLVYIGRISYGVYLWHFPIIAWMKAPVIVELAVVLGVSMCHSTSSRPRSCGASADVLTNLCRRCSGRPTVPRGTLISPAPRGAGDVTS